MGIGDRSLRVTSQPLTASSSELLGEGRARHRNGSFKRKLQPLTMGFRLGPGGAEFPLLLAKPRTSLFSIPHQEQGS